MKQSIKKVGKAVAGSALLVGATLTGAAGFAAAQSSSGMTLGDYPQPFVSEDGQVQSTVVVGESARTIDVVGAVNIAGSLGNAAFETTQKSVSGASSSWSATNGVSLDTSNDQLMFGDDINDVRQTLTEDQLDVLETMEVFDGGAEQDVEQYLYVGQQNVAYGNPGDTSGEEDPFLYVSNPANPTSTTSATSYLYKLQANFQDGVEFEDGQERNDDVYGEEVTMFGKTFTVADDSFTGNGQLVLFGAQEEISVNNGESSTVTVNGNEHTVAVTAVTGANNAAVEIDGDLEEVEEDDEFDVSGETLRIDNIIDTGDNGAGVVQFAIGSERVTLEDGEPVMVGSDEDEVDGTYVTLSGSSDLSSGDASDGSTDTLELSSIEIAVGSTDSDDNYVRAGEMFEDPVFDDLEVHFGGLSPDAMSDSDNVGEVSFSTSGDDVATVSWEDGENSVTQQFAYDQDGDSDPSLEDEDGDAIVVEEGAEVSEDDYVATDAGDFSHLWEVTSIDRDEAGGSIGSEDEATIELEDVVTGASVEVNLDAADGNGDFAADDDDEYYEGTEVIDGQTYNFVLEGDDDSNNGAEFSDNSVVNFKVSWGSGSGLVSGDQAIGSAMTTGDVTLYAAQDTASGAAVALTEPISNMPSAGNEQTYELPSTDGSSTVTMNVDNGGDGEVTVDGQVALNTNSSNGDDYAVNAGGLVYALTVSGSAPNPVTDLALADDQTASNGDPVNAVAEGSAAVIQPENEDGNEAAYVVDPEADTDQIEVGGNTASIDFSGMTANGGSVAAGYNTQTLESDDDVEATVSQYGTYSEQDTDEQGTFNLMVPYTQSTAGAAVTGQEGSLSAEGGAGSVETMSPTGWPDAAALDTDSSVSSARANSNLILVGGPAVNNLVSELAQEGETWTGANYTEGSAMVQLVNDAFSEGNSALVVAGYAGEDTREAANYIANYMDHQEELAGEMMVELTTQQTSSTQ